MRITLTFVGSRLLAVEHWLLEFFLMTCVYILTSRSAPGLQDGGSVQ